MLFPATHLTIQLSFSGSRGLDDGCEDYSKYKVGPLTADTSAVAGSAVLKTTLADPFMSLHVMTR